MSKGILIDEYFKAKRMVLVLDLDVNSLTFDWIFACYVRTCLHGITLVLRLEIGGNSISLMLLMKKR